MANIRFRASKKTTIILLVVLFLIMGGAGGYLLWRVNQQKTVAPTDSEAGSDQVDNCCCDRVNAGGSGIRKCEYECTEVTRCVEPGRCVKPSYCEGTNKQCNNNEDCCTLGGGICKPNGTCGNTSGTCRKDSDCNVRICTTVCKETKGQGTCSHNSSKSCLTNDDCCISEEKVCKDGTKVLKNGPKCTCTNKQYACFDVGTCKCTSGSQCPPCKWPNVAFCNSATGCTCIRYDADGSYPPSERCDDTKPCLSCPAGYGDSYVSDSCKAGEEKVSGSCTCQPCQNPYTATICCKPNAVSPTCGDGKLDSGEQCDPPGSACANGQNCTADCKCPSTPPAQNTCDEVGANPKIELVPAAPAYCGNVRYKYVVGDSDGVGEVTVKLGNTTLTPDVNKVDPNDSRRKFIEGTIAGNTHNCNTTQKSLTISWKDSQGVAGTGGKCTRTISYTPGANICDGGGWDTNGNPGGGKSPETRVYKYCEDIKYSATGRDVHGIKTMTVKLNGATRNVTPTKTATTATVSEVLSSKTKCLAPGTYKLDIAWTDAHDVGGSGSCALTTTFIVSEEVQPEWTIDKEPAEVCIDENTENPKAELSYSIKITNTGTVPGKITKIVDTLDTKVQCGAVSNISNNGVCSNGVITWTLASPLSDFTARQSKTFTYKYVVQKESFGEYENTVVATVGATATKPATTIQDSSNITADCEIKEPEEPYVPPTDGTVPDTGLFDESENLVIMGGILLFLGLGWTWINRTYEIVNGKLVQRSKERFEQRVVKN